MTLTWAYEQDCYPTVVAGLQCDPRDCQRFLHEAIATGQVRIGFENSPATVEELKDRGLIEYDPDTKAWGFYFGVQVSRASLSQWLQSQQPAMVTGANRGRKATYDWDAAWAFICATIHNDGVPEIQAELVRKVQDWFGARDQQPADSEVKNRISMLYRALGR